MCQACCEQSLASRLHRMCLCYYRWLWLHAASLWVRQDGLCSWVALRVQGAGLRA
jgi:hypothetical protein